MAGRIENDIDIYRKTRIEQQSPEHILQAGLGCNLEVIGLIDKRTNTAFGGTIDKYFIEDFALIRAQLGLETRRGASINVESAGGKFDLKGDSPLEKRAERSGPPWKVTTRPDGKCEISISADSPERAVELARHAIRAIGAEGRKPVDVRAKAVSKFLPAIPFEVGLGGPVHFRAIAKSCLNFVCLQLGAKTVLDRQFDDIREYILFGVDKLDELAAGHQDPWRSLACFDFRKELATGMARMPSSGALAHRIVIQGSTKTRVMYASSQLFGHLPYSILLSRSWDGADFCSALVADPVPGGQKFDIQQLKPGTLPEFEADEVLAHSVNVDEFRTSAEAMFESIRPVIENRVFGDFATQALKAVLGKPDGKPITEEQVNRLASEVASRFTKLLYRLDNETPLPPPEI